MTSWLLNIITRAVLKRRLYDIEQFMAKPLMAQELVFNNLIEMGQKTAFGTQFNFSQSIDHFRKNIPVFTYEQFYPYIDRILKGEQKVTWPTNIHWFAKSSGTTNDISKFIPISNESLSQCHFKAGRDMLALYFDNYPSSEIFQGKTLSIGGSHQISKFNNEMEYGDLSAVLIENMPKFYEWFRAPSKNIALLSEWEEKIEKIAHECIPEKINAIAGVPTWTLVLLKRILEITGKNNIHEVWPSLEVFFHGAVKFDPYIAQFRALAPNLQFVETYNASEGYFGVQLKKNNSDMLLLLDHGVFYEFMPLEELGKDFPQTLLIDEVELGKQYCMIISTNGGLWRYSIGDTIIFKSKNPHTFVISGRTKFFINAFGEEVVIDNAEKAITDACLQTNALITEYTAGPIYMNNNQGSHEWIIEFEKEPADLNLFAEKLDFKLQEINSDYAAKRHKSIAMGLPKIIIAPKGTFHIWMRNRGKLGGQNKVPRLSNDRKYIEELYLLINN